MRDRLKNMTNPARWYADGFYFDAQGARIFVKTVGRGPVALCLHAFPTSCYDFSRLAPLLQADLQLVLLDYPGFGYSSKPRDFQYSLFRYADVVEQVCAQLGVGHVHLLAHDIGDSIALELLKRRNLRIGNVVLLNGSVWSIPFTDPLMALSQKLWLHPLTGPLISRLGLFRKGLFGQMLNRTFARHLSAQELGAFWSLVCKEDGLGIYHRLMGYMRERWQHQREWLDALAAHPAPLSLIWGLADPVATPAVAGYVCNLRPDARYVALPGIGHYPHWDAPAAVAEAVCDSILGSNTSSTYNRG